MRHYPQPLTDMSFQVTEFHSNWEWFLDEVWRLIDEFCRNKQPICLKYRDTQFNKPCETYLYFEWSRVVVSQSTDTIWIIPQVCRTVFGNLMTTTIELRFDDTVTYYSLDKRQISPDYMPLKSYSWQKYLLDPIAKSIFMYCLSILQTQEKAIHFWYGPDFPKTHDSVTTFSTLHDRRDDILSVLDSGNVASYSYYFDDPIFVKKTADSAEVSIYRNSFRIEWLQEFMSLLLAAYPDCVFNIRVKNHNLITFLKSSERRILENPFSYEEDRQDVIGLINKRLVNFVLISQRDENYKTEAMQISSATAGELMEALM